MVQTHGPLTLSHQPYTISHAPVAVAHAPVAYAHAPVATYSHAAPVALAAYHAAPAVAAVHAAKVEEYDPHPQYSYAYDIKVKDITPKRNQIIIKFSRTPSLVTSKTNMKLEMVM